jgi:hypothetical protein
MKSAFYRPTELIANQPGNMWGILKVFAEVAPEVPTSVLPQTEGIIQRLVASGQSWVAVDTDGNVVGYALADSMHAARYVLS